MRPVRVYTILEFVHRATLIIIGNKVYHIKGLNHRPLGSSTVSIQAMQHVAGDAEPLAYRESNSEVLTHVQCHCMQINDLDKT